MKGGVAPRLRQLAELNGVQTSFLDAAQKRVTASPEALAGILQALGVPTSSEGEIRESLRNSRLRTYRQGVEPVIVAWEGREVKVAVHLPVRLANKRLQLRLLLEEGRGNFSLLSENSRSGSRRGRRLPVGDTAGCQPGLRADLRAKVRTLGEVEVEGERFAGKEFTLSRLPFGFHTLEILAGDTTYRSLILSAPMKSFSEPKTKKSWGAFLPMYAAHSQESWGAGNFSDWERLSNWIGAQGGTVAATLPLLAAFLDYPVCEPSPYSPASRLFWNEFYLDVTRVPEFSRCREAQALVRAKPFQTQLRAFRRSELIDYRAQWAARRGVLELLANHFFSNTSPRRAEFNRFLRAHPEVKEYSAFRAVCDNLKTSWHQWPQRLRAGSIRKGDFEEATQRFHLYIQWLAHGQVDELIERGERNGVSLYLDLPLGVNPDGYDVWRERESFAMGASAGAPPDLFFSKGQDWGFAPLHPQRIRESGYRYVLAFLRFQMRHARLLRIDHVMGLHRLYWVPRGFEARQGTYVNYPAEELHAIFNLESHRNRTRLVGENLGTVPPMVNQSMERHRLRSMFVVQFEERPDPRAALGPPAALSVASLNTHDTPTFAAHWRGDDLVESVRLGLLPRKDLKNAKKNRERLKRALIRFLTAQGFLKGQKVGVKEVIPALLKWLKASPAEIVLINLEDLWAETRPQNVPGTSSERPNWRRKARLSLEQIFRGKKTSIPFKGF